jgi:hypothetical protein
MATQSYVLEGKTYAVPKGTSLDELDEYIKGQSAPSEEQKAAANPPIAPLPTDIQRPGTAGLAPTIMKDNPNFGTLTRKESNEGNTGAAAGVLGGMGVISPIAGIPNLGLKGYAASLGRTALKSAAGAEIGRYAGRAVGGIFGKGGAETGEQIGATGGALAGPFVSGGTFAKLPFGLGRFLATDEETAAARAAMKVAQRTADINAGLRKSPTAVADAVSKANVSTRAGVGPTPTAPSLAAPETENGVLLAPIKNGPFPNNPAGNIQNVPRDLLPGIIGRTGDPAAVNEFSRTTGTPTLYVPESYGGPRPGGSTLGSPTPSAPVNPASDLTPGPGGTSLAEKPELAPSSGAAETQNPGQGWINPKGDFEPLEATGHKNDAALRQTTTQSMTSQGYVRKVGPGTYQFENLNPKTASAIETDILNDLPEIKKGLGGGSIVIESADRGVQDIPLRDFIEKYNGDLKKAMAAHGDQPGHSEFLLTRQPPRKE